MKNTAFKRLMSFVLSLGLVGTMAQAALADNPHFISASATGPDSSGSLSVSFKEAGLGTAVTVNYEATANATAVYACINGGGNHPKATNKETVGGPVATPGTFTTTKAGTISQSLALSPPSAGSFTCPGGQTLVLAKVSYTNVAITDTTNNISQPISGTFSKTFFNV
jgi:hypothetical protein